MVTVKMRQVDIACDELSAQNRWGIVGPNAGKPGKALRTWQFANLPQFGLEQTTLALGAVAAGDGSL